MSGKLTRWWRRLGWEPAGRARGLRARSLSLVLGLLALVGLSLTEYVAGLATQRSSQVRSIEATALLAQMRAQMESEINAALYLSRGLIAYISAYPDSDPDTWHDLSREIIDEAPLVRNIGLAPDNVLSFVYPRQGNEAAIGLVYRDNPVQWPAVREAIVSGKTKLAGPLALRQGGTGVIARSPIYTRASDGTRRYWGLASIVIDYDRLLRQAEIDTQREGFGIAIRGRDGEGDTGDVFLGDPAVFAAPIASMRIHFPGGSWVIAARHLNETLPTVIWLRLVAWTLIAILIGLIAVIYRFYRLARAQSLTDSLTGEANRRCLLTRAEHLVQLYPRTGVGFALVFVDLNHFKAVNDSHGHHVGDQLLIAAARRLRQTVRASDTLARNGGDEFILLQPGVGLDNVVDLATKIEAKMSEPFNVEGLELHISASVGYALYPGDSEDFETVINLADSRMYARKREKKMAESQGKAP
jgi:diguanylate cyclase (GGDEF)-like protein